MALKDITYKIKAESTQFEATMVRVSTNLEKLGGHAVVAGQRLGIAFAAAGAALAALTVKQIDNIGATRDQAQALGINISSLQAMTLLANEASISQGELGGAMQKAQRAIVEAATGTGEAGNAFAALGLNVNALLQLQPDEQFNTIATALSGVENSTQRTALAMQLFGRGAGSLIPIFNDYSAKLADAEAFNKKFNLSLSEIDASMVDEAGDSFGRVTSLLSGLTNTIAVQLSPVITELSNAFIDTASTGEDMDAAVSGALKNIADAIDVVRIGLRGFEVAFKEIKTWAEETFGFITDAISAVGDALDRFFAKARVGSGIDEVSKSLGDAANAALAPVEARIDSFNAKVMDGFEKTSDKIARAQESARAKAASATKRPKSNGGALLPGTAANSKEVAKDIGLPWLDPGNAYFMGEDYKKLQKEMFDEGKKGIDETSQAAKELGLTFTSAFEDAVIGGKKFSDVLQGLTADIARLILRKSVTEPLANAASGLLGGLFSGASGAAAAPSSSFIGPMPTASSGGSFFGGFFADGGNPPVGKVSVVGERGAELFVPKTAGTIIPNNKIGGGGNTFNLSYNFATGVEATAQSEILKALPALVAASKRGVLEAINRGGSFSRTVGVQ